MRRRIRAINESTKPPHVERGTDGDVVTKRTDALGHGPSRSRVSRDRIPGTRRFVEIIGTEKAWLTETVIAVRPTGTSLNQSYLRVGDIASPKEEPMLHTL